MIQIVPYQKSWQFLFLSEIETLEKAFADLPIHFHHIGSTSIVGCAAKPTIDILGVTPDIARIDSYNAQMVALGYLPLGEYGMKQRRFFKKKGVHLHIFEDSDPEVCRHLRFVQYLNENPALVKEYAHLKKKLAKQFPESMKDYIFGKQNWIKKIDIQAAHARTAPHFYSILGPRKTNWYQEEIIDALQVNMHLQMTFFAKYAPSIELIMERDVTTIRSPLNNDVLNYVIAARFKEENVRERIQYVISLYKEGVPFSWWVSDKQDTPRFLNEELQDKGFTFKEESVGMFLEIPENQKMEGNFQRVLTQEDLKVFSDIIVAVGGSNEVFHTVYHQLPFILFEEGSGFEMYIFYHEGVPVTTGAIRFHAQVSGIYYIATRPEYRYRGFATLMMRYLLKRAVEKGYTVAILQATSQGKSLYERMGFQECCRFREYTFK